MLQENLVDFNHFRGILSVSRESDRSNIPVECTVSRIHGTSDAHQNVAFWTELSQIHGTFTDSSMGILKFLQNSHGFMEL